MDLHPIQGGGGGEWQYSLLLHVMETRLNSRQIGHLWLVCDFTFNHWSGFQLSVESNFHCFAL